MSIENGRTIGDFGAKIGGARKDIRGTMRLDDYEVMTPEERAKLITRDNVWAEPNYETLLEAGVALPVLYAMKIAREGIPTEPPRFTSPEKVEMARRALIAGCGALRDFFARARTVDDLASFWSDPAINQHIVACTVGAPGASGKPSLLSMEWQVGWSYATMRVRGNTARSSVYEFGKDMELFISKGAVPRDSALSREIKLNPEWPKKLGEVERFIAKEKLAIHNRAEVGAVAVWCVARPDLYVRGGFTPCSVQNYADRKLADGRPAIVELMARNEGGWPTEAEARDALRQAVESTLTGRRKAQSAKRAEIKERAEGAVNGDEEFRVGPAWREAGVIVDENAYLSDFRLRGGEFGLWVSGDERVALMARGYDAFRDLADVLGFSPAGISLDGTLALAFGARGVNGAAAAHYEPGRQVINLTKTQGEGTLCHEWGHGFDHYLGILLGRDGYLRAGNVTPSAGPYLSEYVASDCVDLDRLRSAANSQPLAGALLNMCEAAKRLRRVTVRHASEELDKRFKASSAHMANETNAYWENQASRHVGIVLRERGASEAETSATLSFIRRELIDVIVETMREGRAWNKHEINRRYEICQKEAGRARGFASFVGNGCVKYREHHYAIAKRAHEAAVQQGHVDLIQPTEYYRAVRALDATRTNPYWTNPCEMFARGIETIVADALTASGRTSPFLVRKGKTAGEAFPQGQDRADFAQLVVPAIAALPLVGRLEVGEPDVAAVPDLPVGSRKAGGASLKF